MFAFQISEKDDCQTLSLINNDFSLNKFKSSFYKISSKVNQIIVFTFKLVYFFDFQRFTAFNISSL